MSQYAWIITEDNVSEGDDVGIMGPGSAPDDLCERLEKGEGHTFKCYDDDGEHYYTGKAVWREGHSPEGDEEVAVGPLRDFATSNAGAVLIKWANKPSWTAEWC